MNFIGERGSPGIERKDVFLFVFAPEEVAMLIFYMLFEVELDIETRGFEGFECPDFLV